jgi:integrase
MSARIPSYRLHKPSGLSVVTIDRRDHYLGAYGTSESREKYGRLIAQAAAGVPVPPASKADDTVTVGQVVLTFMAHAKEYYRKNGKVTAEYHCLHSAAAPLLELYEQVAVTSFGPLSLGAVQKQMISLGWCRRYINKSINRIRLMFRHAVSKELIGENVLIRLATLPPLQEGRTDAPDHPQRFAVSQAAIDAVREETNPRTRDLIDLALLTGARPGELVYLTGEMIDRTGPIWKVELHDHKMKHKNRRRFLAFGPKAQLILRRYLQADPSRRLFPISRATFSNNIKAACDRLGIPRWTGHWLRHNAATEIRRELGLDAAQMALGHAHSSTTEIYAHLDDTQLVQIAAKLG